MYPIKTQDKLFHDGDGVTELGTIVTAFFLNTLQAELINVLTAAGMTVDENNQKQVAEAIQTLIKKNKPDNATATVAGVVKVLNTLASDDTLNALSAAMGKKLADGKLDKEATAAAATKMAVQHKIGGIPFDGTQDIHFPVSAGYDAAQIYQPGDLVKLEGHWYECYHPDGCKGKDPRDKANRPGGWTNTDETRPYYWIEVGIGSALSLPEIGSPIYLPSTSLREGLIKYRGDANLHKDKFWRLAQRYPNLVQGNYIRIADLRGEFLRGWDDQRGVDANRVVNSGQGDAIRDITGGTTLDNYNGWLANGEIKPTDGVGAIKIKSVGERVCATGTAFGAISANWFYWDFAASRIVPTAPENRPRNVAMMITTRF
ncbi:hypothetical protein PT286_06335 [Neisseriaceae bacterium ESL0693]|nr:hypothetical protein [Neisseriaceae bacterium ESL0693]